MNIAESDFKVACSDSFHFFLKINVTISHQQHKQYERGGITLDKLFIELCQAYHHKILKYLYYSVGNEQDALDLTQEVFVIVYKKMDELIHHENVGGFIYQTAKFMAANHKRKSRTKVSNEVYDNMDQVSESQDAYQTLLKEHEDAIDIEPVVQEVVGMLPDKKQRLYKLKYIEKKSYKEISLILGIKEPAVRMKYVRLRQDIKRLAKKYADTHFDLDDDLVKTRVNIN